MKGAKVILYSKESDGENKLIKEWNLQRGKTYKIGRNPDKTDITIAEGTISRIHAELEFTNSGKLLVKDLASANGTFIDDHQIKSGKEETVQIDQKINLGESKSFLLLKEDEEKERESSPSSSDHSKHKKKTKQRNSSESSRSKSRSRSRHRKNKTKSKLNKYRQATIEGNKHEEEVLINRNEKYEKYDRHGKYEKHDKNEKYEKYDRHGKYDKYPKPTQSTNIKIEPTKPGKISTTHQEKPKTQNTTQATDKPTCDPHMLKYYEEFIKLKQAESKEDAKLKLPKLIDNELLNKGETPNVNNYSHNNLEERFQLRGLVHEKEEFTPADSFRPKPFRRHYETNWKKSKYFN